MALTDPHCRPVEECIAAFGSHAEGLTAAEAVRRLSAHGPNRLPDVKVRGSLPRFLMQFHNILVYLLLGAAVVTFVLQHWVDTGVILAVVLVNAVIGFIQEGKAEEAMAAIRVMLAPRAAVLRDGSRVTVDAADLVPGDIALLEAGDKVPADLRIIEARGLSAQEAILTGESIPVEKDSTPAAAAAALGDRSSMLWSGTVITHGTARGLVVATGTTTKIGLIGGLLEGVEQLTTPLVAQMDYFARWLSLLILFASGCLLGFGYFIGDHDFAEMFMAVVGVAVAAIPEGLPAVMTITLAIGVQQMAQRNAIVRRLPAIEAIGSVSVICTDKTGTLTRNEMVVSVAETAGGLFKVAGDGYAPEGAITPKGDLTSLARAAALCNDAILENRAGHWTVEGDPMEGALLAFAGKIVSDIEAVRLDAVPFDSRHRFMAVLTDAPVGRLIHVKGAPERILPMCGNIDLQHWHARADALARQGLRVLAFAELTVDSDCIDPVMLQDQLTFLGLVGTLLDLLDSALCCALDLPTLKEIVDDFAGRLSLLSKVEQKQAQKVIDRHQSRVEGLDHTLQPQAEDIPTNASLTNAKLPRGLKSLLPSLGIGRKSSTRRIETRGQRLSRSLASWNARQPLIYSNPKIEDREEVPAPDKTPKVSE